MTDWTVSIRDLLKGTAFLQSALFVGTAALVAWGIASLWASKAARSKLGLIGALGLLALAIDEVTKMLRGGKTLIGDWIEKWGGLGAVDSYVRSIGHGLQMINEMGLFGGIWQAGKDFVELELDARKRQARVDELKEQLAAEQDPEKKQVIVRQLINQLNLIRDVSAAQAGKTPRTVTRGLDAAAEVLNPTQATASAINANPLFGGEKAVQTAEGKVQFVDSKVVQLGQINITAKTNASPREIGRHVKRAVRDAIDQEADDIQRSRGRRDEAEDAGEGDGDQSLEGLDD